MNVFGFLFDNESKFGRLMGKISLVVISNLLFIFFSLPIVTIGASYTALCHVMLKSLKSDEEIQPVVEFWTGFKSNFKQATICWAGALLLLSLGYLDLFWSSQIGGFMLYLNIPIAVNMTLVLIILLYLFPVIAAYKNTLRNLFKDAIYYMMSKPAIAMVIVCCNIIPPALPVLDQVNQPAYVFGFFFFGFGLITLISMKLISKTFYVAN